MRYLKYLSGLYLTLLALACAQKQPAHLYQGEQLASEQLTMVTLIESIELFSLDNQKVGSLSGLLSIGPKSFYVKPGKHQLAVRYDTLWELDGDSHESIKSPPVLLELNTLAGEHITVSHQHIETVEQARALAKNFLATASSELKTNPVHSVKAALLTPVFVTAATPSKALASKATPAAEPQTQHSDDSTNKNNTNTPMALPQLKHWWQQANSEERQAFQQWVYQN